MISVQSVKCILVTRIIPLILVVLSNLVVSGCTEDTGDTIDHSKWNYIYAGDYSDAEVRKINATINTTDLSKQESIVLDINRDTRPDLEIISYYDDYMGQPLFTKQALIRIFENCEIIADSTLKSVKKSSEIHFAGIPANTEVKYLDSMIITPKALKANYKIGNDDYWYNGPDNLCFSFYNDYILSLKPLVYESGYYSFYGWGGLRDRYLGVRILASKDTLYGYIKMNIKEFKWIYVENSACR